MNDHPSESAISKEDSHENRTESTAKGKSPKVSSRILVRLLMKLIGNNSRSGRFFMSGIIVGGLIAGIALATMTTIYIQDQIRKGRLCSQKCHGIDLTD